MIPTSPPSRQTSPRCPQTPPPSRSRSSRGVRDPAHAAETHDRVFGTIKTHTGSTANYWLFTGEQADRATGDTGYYFPRARYYDPTLGRFISRDPLLFDQRYAYAGNNPVLYTDRSGLCLTNIECWGTVAGCVAALGDCADQVVEVVTLATQMAVTFQVEQRTVALENQCTAVVSVIVVTVVLQIETLGWWTVAFSVLPVALLEHQESIAIDCLGSLG